MKWREQSTLTLILESPSIWYPRSSSLALLFSFPHWYYTTCINNTNHHHYYHHQITTTTIPNKFSYQIYFFRLSRRKSKLNVRGTLCKLIVFPFHLVTSNYCFGVACKSFFLQKWTTMFEWCFTRCIRIQKDTQHSGNNKQQYQVKEN